MKLFLVTGLPGAGKSTVRRELQARGYEAYDGDEDGLAKWYGRDGLPVEASIEDCTPDFLRAHSRDIARETVEGLAARSGGEIVFICGDPENEAELNDLFSGVFALILDEDTRNQRLAARTNNDWGKLSHQREYSLAFAKKWEEMCRQFGYTTIDAAQTTEQIVDQIVAKVNQDPGYLHA